MFKHGVGDALVIKFTDIFAWDINFILNPRKGDTFEVLYEKNYREGRFLNYGKILAAKYVNNGNTYYAFAMEDSLGNCQYFDEQGNSVQKQFLKAPLHFSRISSRFSYRRKHPILGIYRPHLGIDYAAPTGTPVYSPADGIVTYSGWRGNYGKQVRISHGASYETYFGHLHKIYTNIKPGTKIKQGQVLGTVGATGLATGPHLDYRMKKGSQFINPATLNVPSKSGVKTEDREKYEALKTSYLYALEKRFNKEGCFVFRIKESKSGKSLISKTTANIESKNGNIPNS